MNIRSGPGPFHAVEGRCCWVWHWEDVDLRCDDDIVPGEDVCVEHLIEDVTRQDADQ